MLKSIRVILKNISPLHRSSIISLILENTNISSIETKKLSKNNEIIQLVLDDFTSSIPGYINMNKSFSQNGEDLALQRLIENHPVGRYIDIGAHHPFRFSNTALLNLKGWTGTNIDPSQSSIDSFNKARPKDYNVCTALGKQNSIMTYYEFSEPALNTISETRVRELSSQKIFPISTSQIQVIAAKPFLEKIFTADTFFLTIDIEGLDIEILKDLDHLKCHPCWIIMENQALSLENFQQFLSNNSFLCNYKIEGLIVNSILLKDRSCTHEAK